MTRYKPAHVTRAGHRQPTTPGVALTTSHDTNWDIIPFCRGRCGWHWRLRALAGLEDGPRPESCGVLQRASDELSNVNRTSRSPVLSSAAVDPMLCTAAVNTLATTAHLHAIARPSEARITKVAALARAPATSHQTQTSPSEAQCCLRLRQPRPDSTGSPTRGRPHKRRTRQCHEHEGADHAPTTTQ